jgi:hypothetical protein
MTLFIDYGTGQRCRLYHYYAKLSSFYSRRKSDLQLRVYE